MTCFLQFSRRYTGIINKFPSQLVCLSRNLYADSSIGVSDYEKTRDRIGDQFFTFSDKFKSKMTQFLEDTPTNMIFTDDLKNMVHLCKKHEIDIVGRMVTKFNIQNKDARFGTYVFGPVIMRMYHYFDAPKEALEAFENPNNAGFFDQIISFHILMNLLYKHQLYEDMFRVYEYITTKQVKMMKHPKHVVVLMMAACYKQNTKESFDYACKLWFDVTNDGQLPMRKAATFLAGLAINQGAPHIAIETISSIKQQHYFTIRNLKVVAMANMGRVEDVLPILRSVLDINEPDGEDRHTFVQEAIDKVRDALLQINDPIATREFEKIEQALRQRSLIEQKTLDSLLCQDVVHAQNEYSGKFGSQTEKLHTSFQRGRRTPFTPQRPGLVSRY